jgi:predicted DNA-binding WGR domain protein
MNRFYNVQVMPNLFGHWTVLREWARRGSPGTMRLETSLRREEAQLAEQRTIKRAGGVDARAGTTQWASAQNNLGTALSGLGERESGTARLKGRGPAFRSGCSGWWSRHMARATHAAGRGTWLAFGATTRKPSASN